MIVQGLIALLAVVDALSHLDGLDKLNKQVGFLLDTYLVWVNMYGLFSAFKFSLGVLQLVFLVLTGEAWGYLGSRRFLLEFDQQSDTIKGLDLSMIETVFFIELHYVDWFQNMYAIPKWTLLIGLPTFTQLWTEKNLHEFIELLPEIMSHYRTQNAWHCCVLKSSYLRHSYIIIAVINNFDLKILVSMF